jgi:cation diffusion facilitator family transporter
MVKTNQKEITNVIPSGLKVEIWGWGSIAVNVLLIFINWIVNKASNSLAVEAELVHNVVDLITAVGVLIGLKLADRKSPDFPYGMYKIENLVSVVLAIMTFVTAYDIARDALLEQSEIVNVSIWMLGCIIAAFLLPLIFSHYELQAGKRANSPALMADAREYRVHVFTTGMVFAALVSRWVNLPLDRVAALVIVIAIGATGWELLKDGMRVLLDASLDADTLSEIRKYLESDPAVTEVKWITGRNAGRYRFVESSVALRVNALDKADRIKQRLTSQILQKVPYMDRVLIYVEPVTKTHTRYAAPLENVEGAVSEHFGEAPYFGMYTVRLEDDKVVAQEITLNPYVEEPKAKGLRVAEWLVKEQVDVVIVRKELGSKGPVYVFNDAGVEIKQFDVDTLQDVINL